MHLSSNKIMRYVRENRITKSGKIQCEKVGVLIGWKSEQTDEVFIGWSRCHTKSGDTFDRDEGMRVAHDNMGLPMPASLIDTARRFRVQCFLYFNSAVQEVVEMDKWVLANQSPSRQSVRNSGHKKGCLYPINPSYGCTCRVLSKDMAKK